MIDPQLLVRAFESGFTPLPGRCLIELDPLPDTLPSGLHVPDTARELRSLSHVRGKDAYGDTSWTGKVLAMTPRKKFGEDNSSHGQWKASWNWPEEFKVGDRVHFLTLNEDFNQKVIVTLNTRVVAVVIEPDGAN